MCGEIQADFFHHLRLDRQHDHVRALDRLGVAGKGFDAVLGADFAALFGAAVTGANGAGISALSAQSADQAGGHIAGADKGNARRGHNGLPFIAEGKLNQVVL